LSYIENASRRKKKLAVLISFYSFFLFLYKNMLPWQPSMNEGFLKDEIGNCLWQICKLHPI
jgi:hypothetical protein